MNRCASGDLCASSSTVLSGLTSNQWPLLPNACVHLPGRPQRLRIARCRTAGPGQCNALVRPDCTRHSAVGDHTSPQHLVPHSVIICTSGPLDSKPLRNFTSAWSQLNVRVAFDGGATSCRVGGGFAEPTFRPEWWVPQSLHPPYKFRSNTRHLFCDRAIERIHVCQFVTKLQRPVLHAENSMTNRKWTEGINPRRRSRSARSGKR